MLSDFRSLFRRNDITLLETRQEADDRQVFFFAFKPGLTWKAGQHALFAFRGERLAGRNFRPFSVASTPAENVIAIITTIGSSPSPFKSRLQAMRVGEDISLRGPFGGFYISDYKRPLILLAGGTGISPMRALLKDVEGKATLTDVTLLYLDKPGSHAFRAEFETIEANNPQISISYLEDRESLVTGLAGLIDQHGNGATYFVAGSPAMVRNVKGELRAKGIRRRNTISDVFLGVR